jgi:hypothetical protein
MAVGLSIGWGGGGESKEKCQCFLGTGSLWDFVFFGGKYHEDTGHTHPGRKKVGWQEDMKGVLQDVATAVDVVHTCQGNIISRSNEVGG